MNLVFLRYEALRIIHSEQLELHGGADGLRDDGLLHSAVEQPKLRLRFMIQGGEGKSFQNTLAELATSLLTSIIRNHPFVDGNKRTGCMAALEFLMTNGWIVEANQDDLTDICMRIAGSNVERAEVVAFLESRLVQA